MLHSSPGCSCLALLAVLPPCLFLTMSGCMAFAWQFSTPWPRRTSQQEHTALRSGWLFFCQPGFLRAVTLLAAPRSFCCCNVAGLQAWVGTATWQWFLCKYWNCQPKYNAHCCQACLGFVPAAGRVLEVCSWSSHLWCLCVYWDPRLQDLET